MNKETAVSEEQNFYCEKLEMQKQRGQRDNLCKEQCDTCKNLHIAGRRQDREDAIDSIQSEELWKRMTDKQKADFIARQITKGTYRTSRSAIRQTVAEGSRSVVL
jgi:catalase